VLVKIIVENGKEKIGDEVGENEAKNHKE